jgi:hypothetical protein
VFPRRPVQVVVADLVGGHLVRERHGGVGMSGKDQPMEPVEKGRYSTGMASMHRRTASSTAFSSQRELQFSQART